MTYTNPAAYEYFMGRWSARLAPRFAAFAGIRSGERVLDVGCGTGNLSRALIDLAPNIDVIGIDPAASYVDWASRSLRSPRVRFQVGTAEALAFADAAFDAALALLVVQELVDSPRAVREMARVTRRGGFARRWHQCLAWAGSLFLLALGLWSESLPTSNARFSQRCNMSSAMGQKQKCSS